MQLVYFIVSRLFKSGRKTANMASPMLRVSVTGIALGMAVMLISISIVIGFKREIREKVTGFTAHVHLINFDLNSSYDSNPIKSDGPVMNKIRNMPEIRHIQKFATKPGIVRLETELQAVVLKGISSDYDTLFFSTNLVEGQMPMYGDSMANNQVVISQSIAQKLALKIGDRLPTYFMQQPVRMRNFFISGIYNTNLEMYDELYVLCDIRHIQRLNGWGENEISGFEVFIHDFDRLDEVTSELRHLTALAFDQDKSTMRAIPVTQSNQQIFDWLELQNINVYVIIILMILVSGINMITGLLILILERTQFIGVLKTLGINNKTLQRIFLIRSAQIIGKGILIGNLVGVALITMQHYFRLIKLDASNYYLTHVPVDISLVYWMLINLVAFVCLLAMMIIPVRYVARIQVSKIMRFD